MTKCALGVYEKSMPASLSWRQKLTDARQAGFDYLEISIDESAERLSRLEWEKTERLQLLMLTRETELDIRSMCLSGHRKYPLGSPVAEIENKGIEIMEKALELSYDLGIRLIQLAGYDVYYNAVSNGDTKKRFTENILKAAEKAAGLGIMLGFETMENDFMNTIDKAMEYVRLANNPYLQLYPDVGNITNGTEDIVADIRSGKGHIAAAHLKDTLPGVFRNLKFGEGRVDFKTATQALLEQGVRTFTAEFWDDGKGQHRENLRKSHDFLRPFLI